MALAVWMVLGLCAAITVPVRTSSATDGDAMAGATTIVGRADIGTMGGSPSDPRRTTSAGGATASKPSLPQPNPGAAGAPYAAPKLDGGPARPTWRESEVTLTVDPSYLAMPYAKEALEGALLAWTSAADQLPKVTLRYADDTLAQQTEEQNLADHRIFFAPMGDKRAKGALAITLVTADERKNTILDADILVNGGHLFTDVTVADRGKAYAAAYDLQDVIAHELGHWFGLDEDYGHPEATMYAYVYPGETNKRDLAEPDVTAVQLAYWQADNPSENVGCSIVHATSRHSSWMIGCLAAALLVVRRRNRSPAPDVAARLRRQHA